MIRLTSSNKRMFSASSLGTFRLCGLDMDGDVLTSRKTYCACVSTWTYVHFREDVAKSANFMSSSWVVNVRPCGDACEVRAQTDQVTSACPSPCPVHTIKKSLSYRYMGIMFSGSHCFIILCK